MNNMRKYKLISLVAITVVSFTGCTKYAQPNFEYGHYFMSGDDNCRYTSRMSDTRVMCYNADKEKMGYRDAMTDQQLSMYQHNQQISQQKSQQLLNSLDSLNKSLQHTNDQMNYNNQQMMNRNNVYKGVIQNYQGYDSGSNSKKLHYIQKIGNMYHDSDGGTAIKSGNMLFY